MLITVIVRIIARGNIKYIPLGIFAIENCKKKNVTGNFGTPTYFLLSFRMKPLGKRPKIVHEI